MNDMSRGEMNEMRISRPMNPPKGKTAEELRQMAWQVRALIDALGIVVD